MSNLFTLITSNITKDSILSISKALDLEPEKTTNSINLLIASFLTFLLEKKEEKEVQDIVQQIVENSIMVDINSIDYSLLSKDKSGRFFSEKLFNKKLKQFVLIMSVSTEISTTKMDSLLTIVFTLTFHHLIQKMRSGVEYSEIIAQLETEKNIFLTIIPPHLHKILNTEYLTSLRTLFFTALVQERSIDYIDNKNSVKIKLTEETNHLYQWGLS